MTPSRSRSGLVWGMMFGVLSVVPAGTASAASPRAGTASAASPRAGTASVALAQSDRVLKFETYQDAKKEHRWRLKATNGQTIATSGQGYKDTRDCKSAIDRIKKGAATKLTFETYEDAKKEHRWRLKATNGQIIATSGQGYKDQPATARTPST